jgi:hypothetical protein
MPLTTALPKLVQDLEQLMLDLSTETDPAAARQAAAQRQAQAIYDFVTAGLVQTAGSAASQTGRIV